MWRTAFLVMPCVVASQDIYFMLIFYILRTYRNGAVMKTMMFIMILLYSFSSYAGEIYIWQDKNGVENITTRPPPENAKIKDRAAFKRDKPRAIETFQRKQKAAIDKGYAGWQKSQTRDLPSVDMREETAASQERKKKIENTDQISKKFWDAVALQRTRGQKVDGNLREQYLKAVEDDPRAIKTITTTTRGR